MAVDRKQKQLGKGRHKSAMKRARQNEQQKLRNRTYRTRVRTAIKELRAKPTTAILAKTLPLIDKATSKGVFSRGHASRMISRLTHLVNRATA